MPAGAAGCAGAPKATDRSGWFLTLGYGQFDSELSFDGVPGDVDVHQKVIAVGAGKDLGGGVLLALSAGVILDGELGAVGVAHHVDPGATFALQIAYEWLGEVEPLLVLITTATIATSIASTGGPADADYVAVDLRVGVRFGVSLFDAAWRVYALGRAFGGPVFWEHAGADVTGSDVHHYEVGLGTAFSLPGGVGLSFDGSFFGQRSFAAGVSYSF